MLMISNENVRELSIVLNLILEVSELCDNLFALLCSYRVGALRNGAVGIVNGLCLSRGSQSQPEGQAMRVE